MLKWFKSSDTSEVNRSGSTTRENKALVSKIGETTAKNAFEQEAFLYTPHVFELNQQVKKQVESLLLEEGKLTFVLSNILSMTEYTTDQIHQVEDHLGDLAKNNIKTVNAVEGVFVDLEASKAEIDKASEGMDELTKHMDDVSSVFEDFFRLFDELQHQYQSIGNLATIINNIAFFKRSTSYSAIARSVHNSWIMNSWNRNSHCPFSIRAKLRKPTSFD